jgi:hypothetical protein
MDVTCTLLAPHLAPGVRLVPSYMLHSLLSGGTWRSAGGPPFFLRAPSSCRWCERATGTCCFCSPGARTVGVMNSMGSHGQDGVVGPVSRALGLISSTGAWEVSQSPSHEKKDGSSCGLFALHCLLSWSNGDAFSSSSPPGLSPGPSDSLGVVPRKVGRSLHSVEPFRGSGWPGVGKHKAPRTTPHHECAGESARCHAPARSHSPLRHYFLSAYLVYISLFVQNIRWLCLCLCK